MKLSVSLPDDEVGFIDVYARSEGLGSRSAVIRRALVLLRSSHLADDYAAAWRESSDDQAAWDAVVTDGLESDR